MSEFLERISKLSSKRLALLAAELNSSLERVKRQTAEPIAIIGMGCRFPGGANDPESFWKMLIEGREGVSEVPPDRWDIESLYDPNPDSPGKMSTRRGGFLRDVDRFDPEFFGISPREAAGMDPQQRLLLEVAWEALENAGRSPEELAGTRTGVFAGVCNSDYYVLQREGGSESSDIYAATGNAHSVVSGRISYVLGLVGPSVSVDTSCSASLVAVHLACQSLRLSECGMALAGGVNLILKPDVTVTLSRAHMMSPDGRCKAFDAAADGFVRAEGCGMVVLKRLSDAQNDGDRILAVIRGTACNQDGRSSGLTAPNGPSQVALIRDALANAGLQPADIGFIEAHGTGTSLGDPVEAGALAEVFGPGRRAENPLQIGSVKTNIGHAESAAGIAGLIKAVLALQHERIPASLHFDKLNPAIEWDVSAIRVTAKESKWNSEKGRRAAGVSSFGFSGTNAHVIVSDVIDDEAIPIVAGTDLSEPRFHLLPLSARTEPALVELAREYQQVFTDRPDLNLADACYTAGVGRSHFAHRLAVVASNFGEASRALGAYGRGERSAQILSGYAKSAGAPGVVFMFTGQGSQYVGMGRELYETQPVFRRELDRCAEILKPKLEKPLLEAMFGGTEADHTSRLLDETQYTQPALFALEYALAALWRSWGIEPAAVLGHSAGEYVAACVAGILSLEDALGLIADRGRLMQALARDGAMAAVFADEERVRAAIDARHSSVSIAAVNSPQNTVISGNAEDVDAVLERLEKKGVEAMRLAVSHAFHSALIEPMLDEFEVCARGVQHKAPTTDLVLNETGCVLDRNSPLDAGYWRRHARGTVRFAKSIETLRARGMRVFLEIGAAPVLIGMARQCGDAANATWLGSLRRDRDASSEMLASLGALYALGHIPNWRAVQGGCARRRLALPTYPFQRQRHWLSTDRTSIALGERVSESRAEFDDWLYEVRWVPREESAIGRGAQPIVIMPRSETIKTEIQAIASELWERSGLARCGDGIRGLEVASLEFVVQALTRLGWSPKRGERISTSALCDRLRVIPQHRRMFGRLMEMLEEEGFVSRHGETWIVQRIPVAGDAEITIEALAQAFPQCAGEISMLRECGTRLAEVLTGACDPLGILFPDGSMARVEKLTQEAPASRVYNEIVARVIEASLARLPQGRLARILEIGAGTGGTTSAVLPRLSDRRVEYEFTDVSQLFLTKAKQKFAGHKGMKYALLNIEQAPGEQGFEDGTFDVVVAANVLHATRDLRETLKNVRQLLAPGGILVLFEATSAQRWVDLTFGLTEGWWRFSDYDLRAHHPLVSGPVWSRLLEESGFDQVSMLPDDEGVNFPGRPTIVMCKKKLEVATLPGLWLLLTSNEQAANPWREALQARGQRVFVAKGESNLSDVRSISESYRSLLRETLATRGVLRGVLHLTGVEDPKLSDDADLATLEASVRRGCVSALSMTQALASENKSELGRLWFFTRGALPTADYLWGIDHAPLWGLGRTVAVEHPEFWGGLIDVGDADAQSIATAVDQLLNSGGENQIAVVGEEVRVGRLVHCARNTYGLPSRARFRADAGYLVTGGFGGTGRLVLDWMAEQGARHIAVIGRSADPENPDELVAALGKRGVHVMSVRADVSDDAALGRAFEVIKAELPPLAGVFHLAGTFDECKLTGQDWSRFENTLKPKVAGAWNLHQRTKHFPLDFFVLFSSAASFLPSVRLGDYVAGNTFLDALAFYRRARGLPAVSIDWGLWKNTGMAAAFGDDWWNRAGFVGMTPRQGLAALAWLMHDGPAQVGVLIIDWAKYLERFGDALPPMYAEMQRGVRPLAPSDLAAGQTVVAARQWQGATPVEKREVLFEQICNEIADVLGFARGAQLDCEQGLFDLGMDSLTAIELKDRLQNLLGKNLPATLFFDYPSIEKLMGYITREVLDWSRGNSSRLPVPTISEDGVSRCGDSSEDEIAELLAQKLQQLK